MSRIRRFLNGEVTEVQPLHGFLVVDGTDLGEDDGPAALPLTDEERPGFVKRVRDVLAQMDGEADIEHADG